MTYKIYITPPPWVSRDTNGDIIRTPSMDFTVGMITVETDGRIIAYKKHETTEYAEGDVWFFLSDSPCAITYKNARASIRTLSDDDIFEGTSALFDQLYPLNDLSWFDVDRAVSAGYDLYINPSSTVYNNFTDYTFAINVYTDEIAPIDTKQPTSDPETTGLWIGYNKYKYTDHNSKAFNTFINNDLDYPRRFMCPIKWIWGGESVIDPITLGEVYRAYRNNGYAIHDTGHWVDVNPFIGDIYVTEDLPAAKKYIEDGTVPDDAVKATTDEDGKPQHDNPIPPDPPHRETGDDDIDTTPNTSYDPTQTPYALSGINVYMMSYETASNFINWFWNDMITDWQALVLNTITGLYGNMANCVLSIRQMYCASGLFIGGAPSVSGIALGRYFYNTPGVQKITSGALSVTSVGTYNFPDEYNNFIDAFPHTNVALYLPFVGTVSLDVPKLTARTLEVKAVADIYSMTIEYGIYVNGAYIGGYNGTCGAEIPFSVESSLNILTNAVKSIPSLMGGDLSHDYSTPQNIQSGVSQTLSKYNPGKCHVIITRDIPDNSGLYDKTTGNLLVEKKKLSDIKGFTIIDNPRVQNIYCTREEMDMIYAKLKEGIYL